jgi:hypothetical protein
LLKDGTLYNTRVRVIFGPVERLLAFKRFWSGDSINDTLRDILLQYLHAGGRDNSVGITTGYGLDGPGIEFR